MATRGKQICMFHYKTKYFGRKLYRSLHTHHISSVLQGQEVENTIVSADSPLLNANQSDDVLTENNLRNVREAFQKNQHKTVYNFSREYALSHKKEDVTLNWRLISAERMEVLYYVLRGMLHTNLNPLILERFYKKNIRRLPNVYEIYESEYLDFLLRYECEVRKNTESINEIIHEIEILNRTTSSIAAVAHFCFILSHVETSGSKINEITDGGNISFSENNSEIAYEDNTNFPENDSDKANEDNISLSESDSDIEEGHNISLSENDSGTQLLSVMDEFPSAYPRDSNCYSLMVSAAAIVGKGVAVADIVNDAIQRGIPLDVSALSLAVAGMENERETVVALFSRAADLSLIVEPEIGEKTEISNYLLSLAIKKRKVSLIFSLLNEMQLFHNQAFKNTIKAIFGFNGAKMSKKSTKSARFSPLQLIKDFPNVIPTTSNTITQAINASLTQENIGMAIKLLHLLTSHITLNQENVHKRAQNNPTTQVFADVLFPMYVDGGLKKWDSLHVQEVESLFIQVHSADKYTSGMDLSPYLKQRFRELYTAIMRSCYREENFVGMVRCLDNWQERKLPPLSKTLSKCVIDLLKAQKIRTKVSANSSSDDEEISVVIPDRLLSFYLSSHGLMNQFPIAFGFEKHDHLTQDEETKIKLMQQYMLNATILQNMMQSWREISWAIIVANENNILLHPKAYGKALKVLVETKKWDEAINCLHIIQRNGYLDQVQIFVPEVSQIVSDLDKQIKETPLST